MKRKIALVFALTTIAIVLIIININVASAQQKIFKLKWASPMPPRHASAQLWEWYGAELDKRSGGRIKVTYYHAGSLGAGPVIWENILKGIAPM